jgi:hypothetical protein
MIERIPITGDKRIYLCTMCCTEYSDEIWIGRGHRFMKFFACSKCARKFFKFYQELVG